jgi:hypothetical protein
MDMLLSYGKAQPGSKDSSQTSRTSALGTGKSAIRAKLYLITAAKTKLAPALRAGGIASWGR